MAESKVNRENYIVLQGFMLTDLKLKGNELIIYACIYGFSQSENQVFNGSLQYLADWTNSTKQGVVKCLKSLIEKGYIHKTEKYINGVKFCEYYATKFNTPMQQSLTGGMQQSLPNNIDINNISNNKEKERKSNSFDALILEYAKTVDISIKADVTELLGEWLKVRKAKRAAMTDRAIKLNIDKLDRLAKESGLSVNAYLEEVICRGWGSFFPLNNKQGSTPKAETKTNNFEITGGLNL